ncbi:MAG: carboxymuconolactone decarboxylase family protein [Methanosarcinaceae archaeon]|nr:carboxymuconolactone decarboxylase family protein [Methanosarcinaceae archaeon]
MAENTIENPPGNPLQKIMDIDPEFGGLLENTRELAMEKGGIPLKYRILIAMALDASKGAENGVRVLAEQAMQEGATKEELIEAIRIAQYVCGVGAVYTAARAFDDLL